MKELGTLRPSQMIFTFGVGSLIDLPQMSVMVMGLDDWDTTHCREITEDRLVAAIRKRVGVQMAKLYFPPVDPPGMGREQGGPVSGIPVAPFPRWMRCSRCSTLATVESGVFSLVEDSRRSDRTRYVHPGCHRQTGPMPPPVLSVRFLMACREGHLTDFPWIRFVHHERSPCVPSVLSLQEYGISGDASDIVVSCASCGSTRYMSDAFELEGLFQPVCPGHHPHLRMVDREVCGEKARTILLGASNSWFPTSLSVLSIPVETDPVGTRVEEHWETLKDVAELVELAFMRKRPQQFGFLLPLFADFSDGQILEAIAAQRERAQQDGGELDAQAVEDLKLPEWQAFSQPETASEGRDFKLRATDPPTGLAQFFERTVLVERIREVRALLGFTRIESNADFAEATVVPDGRMTRICRDGCPKWLPATEVRGEGIFLRVREEAMLAWQSRPAVQGLEKLFRAAHESWRKLRLIEPPQDGFPGMRFVLLHSLAHALMRQIVLDCGYTSASLRERIYCREPTEHGGSAAGILLYTAVPDSEGTLGGLVELGHPDTLGRHVRQALESMRLCASDPLCAEHQPDTQGRGIHGACCHACQFAPETSCERGNRYLDRSVLVETFAARDRAFFG
jgi:hypothetical protein